MQRKHKVFVTGALLIPVIAALYGVIGLNKRNHQKRLRELPEKERGSLLLEDFACSTCHQSDSSYRAPVLKGLLGKSRSFSDGTHAVIDEHYLREAILDPQLKIVEGYQAVMPSYRGRLDEDEVVAIIEAIK